MSSAYTEPEWSKQTACPGFFEVLKNGTVFERIPIPKGTSHMSFGRLPENSIQLDHESVSRYHAIVQFGPRNAAFLYDLGSTHGTFLNKKQVPARQYIKLTPENDLIHFGGSTRFHVLSLPPVAVEVEKQEPTTPESSFKTRVLAFFEENGINQKDIEVTKENGLISCCLDFSEYLSVESREEAIVISSGSEKAEALDNFFEDSFNLLTRLGFMSMRAPKQAAESEVDEEECFDEISKNKAAITEDELVDKRDALESEIQSTNDKINSLLLSLNTLESEEVDDFDIYIKQAKMDEIKQDIIKCERQKTLTETELQKCESILWAIGYKEPSESEPQKKVKIEKTEKTEKLQVKETKIERRVIEPETELVKSENQFKAVPSDSQTDYNEFEDATDPSESNEQVEKLKRKFNY